MDIELNEARRKVLLENIQLFFQDELEVSIGELKAQFILEFFLKELGPRIYNQAIEDAYAFIQDKLIDLEGTLSVPE